jgi:microcompartment protein CcmK/EutM
MILGMIVGTIVSNTKADNIHGSTYLLVDKCDQQGNRKKDFLVALDMLGSGYGELVIVSQGSACRNTSFTEDRPIDAMIVGIVDLIDQNNRVTFKK